MRPLSGKIKRKTRSSRILEVFFPLFPSISSLHPVGVSLGHGNKVCVNNSELANGGKKGEVYEEKDARKERWRCIILVKIYIHRIRK
jgi:hypothetical protein